MDLLKQTDFKEEKNGAISYGGCLMMSLFAIPQLYLQKAFRKDEILFMYDHVIKRGYMKDGTPMETDDDKKNACWVLDHAAIANEGFSFLLHPELGVEYVGAFYVDEQKGTSWGVYHGDYLIIHGKTPLGHGHFELMEYDPYEPHIKLEEIYSIRYYRIGRRHGNGTR